MAKKRILFVMMRLKMGGAERSLINLLNELDYGEFEVDLILLKKMGELLPQIPSQVRLLDTPFELRALYSNKILGVRGLKYFAVRALSVLCSGIVGRFRPCEPYEFRWKHFYTNLIPPLNEKYDVAIAYLTGPSMYYTSEKVTAGKRLTFVHNDYITSGLAAWKETERRYFKSFDLVPTISEKCRDSLVKVFPELREKFVVIPNLTSEKWIAACADEFYPKEYIGKSNIVLSVGRLTQQKGFDIAVNAAALLKKDGVDFTWFIVGEGDQRKELERMISRRGLQETVCLLGVRNNPYPYIRHATVVAQTSRTEGKSVVLDEAKILQRPILATHYSTVGDQLSAEEGYVVEMTAEAVAQGIRRLLTHPEDRERYIGYLAGINYGNTGEIQKFYDALM